MIDLLFNSVYILIRLILVSYEASQLTLHESVW